MEEEEEATTTTEKAKTPDRGGGELKRMQAGRKADRQAEADSREHSGCTIWSS